MKIANTGPSDAFIESNRQSAERMHKGREKEADREVAKEKNEILKQEVQLQEQQQATNNLLIVGCLSVSALLVVSVVIFLIIKTVRSSNSQKR